MQKPTQATDPQCAETDCHTFDPSLAWTVLSTLKGMKDDLSDLAGVLNQFENEAVQVKVLDRLFDMLEAPVAALTTIAAAQARRGSPPKVKRVVVKPTKAEVKRMTRKSMGATGAVHALISKGYFKTRRTIADIVRACESRVGVRIKVTHLSGPLGNFVKGKKLQRAKNKDGRFEYWVK